MYYNLLIKTFYSQISITNIMFNRFRRTRTRKESIVLHYDNENGGYGRKSPTSPSRFSDSETSQTSPYYSKQSSQMNPVAEDTTKEDNDDLSSLRRWRSSHWKNKKESS